VTRDFAEQVRYAKVVARQMLINGIDPTTYPVDEPTIIERVAEVLDDPRITRKWNSLGLEARGGLGRRLAAAVALGVALGLMLRPDVFPNSDTRPR
jgi:hypothetical protein